MTCRVQTDPQHRPSDTALPRLLELAEFSYMGSRGIVSVTVRLRCGDRTDKGQSAADRKIITSVYGAIADAARALDVFAPGELPRLDYYRVESFGPGADAAGTFTVCVLYRGQRITVRLRNGDDKDSSAAAFVAAFNQLLAGPPSVPDPADDIGEGYMASD